MAPASYYSPDGDLAYFHLREPQGKAHSEEQPWGLRDLDETGALVGLELWGASEALPPAFLEALPRLEGRGVTVEKTPEGLVVREPGLEEEGGMRFVIYQDSAGEWRWRLVAANNEIVADSAEGYDSKSNIRRAIQSVRKCGGADIEVLTT